MNKPLVAILVLAVLGVAAGVYVAIAPETNINNSDAGAADADPGATASRESDRTAAVARDRQPVHAISFITGRVIDATGTPLKAQIEYGDALAGETDDNGEFKHLPLPDRRNVNSMIISATEWHSPAIFMLEGEAAPPLRKLNLKIGENDLGTIKLQVSGAVRGNVVDDRGFAVEDANVSMFGARGTRVSANTDAGGGFLLNRVPVGTLQLSVALGARDTRSKPVKVIARQTIDVGETVLARSPGERAMRGKIVSSGDGNGIAGAHVRLLDTSVDAGFPSDVYTDNSGHFTIPGIQETRKMVKIEVESHGFPRKEFGPTYPEGENNIFQLDGGARIELFVTDASTGQPVQEFGAWSCPPDKRLPDDEKPPILKHPGGIIQIFASAPKRTRVVVDAPGYPMFEGHIELAGKSPEIKLPPGSKVRVTVLHGGAPVSKVSVFLSNPNPGTKSFLASFVRDANIADITTSEFKIGKDGGDYGIITPQIRARPVDRLRTTNGSGIVEFDSIPPGSYAAIITDRFGARSRSDLFEVKVGERAEIVTSITAPGALSGILVAANPEKHMIYVKRTDGVDPQYRGAGTPAADGKFIIQGLNPGRYRATIHFPGDANTADFESPCAVDFTINDGAETPIELNSVAEGRGAIAGRIQFIGSVPDRVKLTWVRAGAATLRQGDFTGLAPDGNYRIENVSPGKISLEVKADDVLLATLGPVELKSSESIEISTTIAVGTARIRADGSGDAQINLVLPPFQNNIARSFKLPCDFTVYCREGDISASINLNGNLRSAKGKVLAGTQTLLDLQ
ncbi:MAG: carboxypeptidase regulatory-like domain-containing protein [Planctomycetes bacterium]|nr:carboxypeptidase regulatory-like domain-containing protein [Planctomycetota bacterium]